MPLWTRSSFGGCCMAETRSGGGLLRCSPTRVLGRRFTFEELMPDAGVIRSTLQARVPEKGFGSVRIGEEHVVR